jgi:hypothetical protein
MKMLNIYIKKNKNMWNLVYIFFVLVVLIVVSSFSYAYFRKKTFFIVL